MSLFPFVWGFDVQLVKTMMCPWTDHSWCVFHCLPLQFYNSNSCEGSMFSFHIKIHLHILNIFCIWGSSVYLSIRPGLSSLGGNISTSEWSNDRPLKSFRMLQSFRLCFSVKSSGCRTSRNTWGPGWESFTQVSTCSFSLSEGMLGCSRSGVQNLLALFNDWCGVPLDFLSLVIWTPRYVTQCLTGILQTQVTI